MRRTPLDAARAWTRRVRAAQWAHFVPLPAASVRFDGGLAPAIPALGRGALAAALILAWGYLLNAVADREMDLDAAKNPLTREPPARHLGALSVLAAGALAAAAVSPWALGAACVSLLSGWLYSAGPRWKALPLLGTALNVTSFTPLLLLASRSAADARGAAPLALTFAALLVQNQLLHEAADLVEDRRGGVNTTFAALGPDRCAWVAVAVALVACAAAGSLRASPGWATATLAVTAFAPLALWRRWDPLRARRTHRVASGLLGVALFVAAKS